MSNKKKWQVKFPWQTSDITSIGETSFILLSFWYHKRKRWKNGNNNYQTARGTSQGIEKEKKALEIILKAVPKMSEFQKGRLYGIAEAMEEQNKTKGEQKLEKAK